MWQITPVCLFRGHWRQYNACLFNEEELFCQMLKNLYFYYHHYLPLTHSPSVFSNCCNVSLESSLKYFYQELESHKRVGTVYYLEIKE